MVSKYDSASRMLQKLESLSRFPRAGPAPGFSHVHVCSVLLTIGDDGPLGRIELSKRLGLGEGAIRTIIKRLTKAKIIRTVSQGCILTETGRSLYKGLRRKLSKVLRLDAKQLALDKVGAAILVRNSARLVKRGVEQRDAAIRVGATGACTLVLRKKDYLMPMSDDAWKLGREEPLAKDLDASFNPKDNDVVIVASGRDKMLAAYGAIAAALTLLE